MKRVTVLAMAAAAAVAAPLAAPVAWAGLPTDHSLARSGDLAEACASNVPALRAMCTGYLAAVSDDIERDRSVPRNTVICTPPGLELEVYRLAFVTFAAAHPDYRDRSSFDTVKAALAHRWPCPAGSK